MNRKPLNKIRKIILEELEMDDITLCILNDKKRIGIELNETQIKTYKNTVSEKKDWCKLLKLVNKYLIKGNKSQEMYTDD